MPGLENKVVAKFSVEMLTHITEAAFDHDKYVFDETKPLNDFLLEVGFKSLGVLAGMLGEDFAKAFGDEKGPVIFEAISKMFENTSEYLEKASERKDVVKKKRD